MTNEQKTIIDSLRSQGLGYKKISTLTGISQNTVKSYLRKMPVIPGEAAVTKSSPPAAMEPIQNISDHQCEYCGKPIVQLPGRKRRRFCSDGCRNSWWNEHLDLVKRKAVYHFTCPTCGKEFTAYGNAHRKYCSHVCYIDDRFGGVK